MKRHLPPLALIDTEGRRKGRITIGFDQGHIRRAGNVHGKQQRWRLCRVRVGGNVFEAATANARRFGI
jgi:hypothetical protein